MRSQGRVLHAPARLARKLWRMPAPTDFPSLTARSRAASPLPWLLLAAWLATAPPGAVAQPVITTPAPVASTNSAPGPQRPSPEAVRDSATALGSLRPERAALPQVTVRMGLPPAAAPAASVPGALPPNPAASAGGISDAVARCEAKTSTLERRACRRQLAQQAPTAR
jgi:hypothetical protein